MLKPPVSAAVHGDESISLSFPMASERAARCSRKIITPSEMNWRRRTMATSHHGNEISCIRSTAASARLQQSRRKRTRHHHQHSTVIPLKLIIGLITGKIY